MKLVCNIEVHVRVPVCMRARLNEKHRVTLETICILLSDLYCRKANSANSDEFIYVINLVTKLEPLETVRDSQ